MKTFHLEEIQLCPKCGKTLDAATNVVRDAMPDPGDVTVCIGCAAVLQFGPEMKLSEAKIEEMPAEIRRTLEEVIWAVHKVKGKR